MLEREVMFNIFLIFFVFAELSFYLLIAQTGVVEVFHSKIALIAFLPIGGVIGTYLGANLKMQEHYKALLLLSLQIFITYFYPHLNPLMLFLLGIAVGGMSPIIIQTIKKATKLDLMLSLGSAYVFGTFFFTSNPFHREALGLILSMTALLSYIFIEEIKTTNLSFVKEFYSYPLYLMVAWVFLDSSLFETLSRDVDLPIWRGGFEYEIMLFHTLGILAALTIRLEYYQKIFLITIMFMLSYLFYFTKEPLFLSIVYPFVISYYNIVILQSLIKVKNLKRIGVYMIFIGWVASGSGLMVALSGYILYVPLLFIVFLVESIQKQINLKKKELYHG